MSKAHVLADITIGCVGKPSAGKSTFFNAVSEGKAKTGNFPFTTIEPNVGISYYRVVCPCVRRNKEAQCSPRYGWCDGEGGRFIPVRLLDVAGLVPGAAEGEGLGNKFLNDLTGASVLLHVIDVSGTTNAKGEATVGYDPINDVQWLEGEISSWIFGNLWEKWNSVARRHAATKATAEATLAAQFSGYGGTPAMVAACLKKLRIKEPSNLPDWDEAKVRRVVDAFIKQRFPTMLVLNKAETGGDTDKNIGNICEKYDPDGDRCVVASALTECFLKNLRQKGFIRYPPGADDFVTADDLREEEEEEEDGGDNAGGGAAGGAGGSGVLGAAAAAAAGGGSGSSSSGGGAEEESKASSGGGGGGGSSGADAAAAAAEAAAEGSGDIVSACRGGKGRALHELKPKMRQRLATARDMVLFRYGGTGVWDAVQRAIDFRKPVVVYPVRSLTNLSTERSGPGKGGVLASALLVKPETTVKQLATKLLGGDSSRAFSYAEAEDGRRMGEDDPVGKPGDSVIIRIHDVPAVGGAGGGGGGAAGGAAGDD